MTFDHGRLFDSTMGLDHGTSVMAYNASIEALDASIEEHVASIKAFDASTAAFDVSTRVFDAFARAFGDDNSHDPDTLPYYLENDTTQSHYSSQSATVTYSLLCSQALQITLYGQIGLLFLGYSPSTHAFPGTRSCQISFALSTLRNNLCALFLFEQCVDFLGFHSCHPSFEGVETAENLSASFRKFQRDCAFCDSPSTGL